MPYPRSTDISRPLSKAISADDISYGTAKLQEVLAAIKDLRQEGFPYREAAKTKAELQFRECVKQIFGEDSDEFRTYRHYKIQTSSEAETARSIAVITSLLQTLENLQSVPQRPPAPKISRTSRMTTTDTLRLRAKHPSSQPPSGHGPLPPPNPSVLPPALETNPRIEATTHARPPSPLPDLKTLENQVLSDVDSFQPMTPRGVPSTPSSPPPLTVQTIPLPVHSTRSPVDPPPPLDTPLRETPAKPAPAIVISSPSSPEPMPSTPTVELDVSQPAEAVVSTTFPPPATTPDSEQESLRLIRKICLRFHAVARQLRLRRDCRPTLAVEDDHDLEDLLQALLRLEFDEVGVDEWTPPYGGPTPKTALLVNREQIVIVAKKTRPGLTSKDIADHIRADSAFHSARHTSTTLFCFIYDPEGRIGSPKRLETDLCMTSKRFTVEVLVAPK